MDFKLPVWEKKRGVYRSEIRIDFFGKPYEADLRKNKFIYVFDNNMFATGYVFVSFSSARHPSIARF